MTETNNIPGLTNVAQALNQQMAPTAPIGGMGSAAGGFASAIGFSLFIKGLIYLVIIGIIIGVVYYGINFLSEGGEGIWGGALERVGGIISGLVGGVADVGDVVGVVGGIAGDVADVVASGDFDPDATDLYLTALLFDTSDESITTTDKYNWELPSIAEEFKSPPGEDVLSDCQSVNIFGNTEYNKFYKKKCYLKFTEDNPYDLLVGDIGTRYEAGLEPVLYSDTRYSDQDDLNGRFIPQEGYTERARHKNEAIQSGELVDVCSLETNQVSCGAHIIGIDGDGGELSCEWNPAKATALDEWNQSFNIPPVPGAPPRGPKPPPACSWFSSTDCSGSSVDECDTLENDEYKCKYNNSSSTCETVPKYTLSEEYNFNIPGRRNDNSHYIGCYGDYQDINGNSGLQSNIGLNTCNFDTIKHIVYSNNLVDELIIGEPESYTLNYDGGTDFSGIGCTQSDINTYLGIVPTKYKVPYCYEFVDPRVNQEDGDLTLISLNDQENARVSLVGACHEITDSSECNCNELPDGCDNIHHENCEWDIESEICKYKPKRICNEDIDCSTITTQDNCGTGGLENVCEWDNEFNICRSADCIPLSQSSCDSIGLQREKYVSNDCPDENQGCEIPSDNWIMGDIIPCPLTAEQSTMECPPNYVYDSENENCNFICNNSDYLSNQYRCTGCTGSQDPGDGQSYNNAYWDSIGTEAVDGDTLVNANKCRTDYVCIEDGGDRSDNQCLNTGSLGQLSGTTLQSDLCFKGPHVPGLNPDHYSYWNFGMLTATHETGDPTSSMSISCVPFPGINPDLYVMDKGFSPIIQTMFSTTPEAAIVNTPFISDTINNDMCIKRDIGDTEHDCSFISGDAASCESKSHCKYIPPFDSYSMFKDGTETSSDNWKKDEYVRTLECLHNSNIMGDHSNSEQCRIHRYDSLRDTMLNLRRYLNINIDEDTTSINLTDLTDNSSGGIPSIGSIHPCANEEAYLALYRQLQDLRTSLSAQDRLQYVKAIYRLNGAMSYYNTKFTLGDGDEESVDSTAIDKLADPNLEDVEYLSVLPPPGSDDVQKIMRTWVTAGDRVLSQSEACRRHNSSDIPCSAIENEISNEDLHGYEINMEWASGIDTGDINDEINIYPFPLNILSGDGDISTEHIELNDDTINKWYRLEYGNMLEQLCHYRVQVESGSRGVTFDSLKYTPINDSQTGGEPASRFCSKCRSPGDSLNNRCFKMDDNKNHCLSNSLTIEQLAVVSVDEGVNSCNDDGSCRCGEFNNNEEGFNFYLPRTGDDIDKCTTTSTAPSCGTGQYSGGGIIYKNDNMNEAVFGFGNNNLNTDPLCDCRGEIDDDGNHINHSSHIYFGAKCDKLDTGTDPDDYSCHGQLSEYEFSYDGTDYKKIEYIKNKINLLQSDNLIFFNILKYLYNRTKAGHRQENATENPSSELLHQFSGYSSGNNHVPGFWNNIEARSKKRIVHPLHFKENWDIYMNTDADTFFNESYTDDKIIILNKLPISFKDILLEIKENGNKYSPAQGQESNKMNYIFPHHEGTRNNMLPIGDFPNDSQWRVSENHILSPDSLFYHYYRNTDKGPTLCDCTTDSYRNTNISESTTLNTGYWNLIGYNYEALLGFPQPGSRQSVSHYKARDTNANWGYRCELNTDCSSGGAGTADGGAPGNPIFSSLGESLPSNMGGKDRDMFEADKWKYMGVGGEYLYPVGFITDEGVASSYNYFPNNNRNHGGPSDTLGCKKLSDTGEIENCDDNTTWNNISKYRFTTQQEDDGELYNENKLEDDISKGSGRLPEYIDLKGHKPLLCDCSYSIVNSDNTWTQSGDSGQGPTFGDYCEFPTNQSASSVASDPIINYTNHNLSNTSALQDGVCNFNNLESIGNVNSIITRARDNNIITPRMIEAPNGGDCNLAGTASYDYTGGDWASDIITPNNLTINGAHYIWSCNNVRGGDSCDEEAGGCICDSGSCINHEREHKLSPINYSKDHSIGHITRNVSSYNTIYEHELNKLTGSEQAHPKTMDIMRNYDTLNHLETEYRDRKIARVPGGNNYKSDMCNCEITYLQGEIGKGCNVTNDNLCSGNGIAQNNSGQLSCDCNTGFMGATCNSCDPNQSFGTYPNCAGSYLKKPGPPSDGRDYADACCSSDSQCRSGNCEYALGHGGCNECTRYTGQPANPPFLFP